MSYPAISNWLNQQAQDHLIQEHDEMVSNIDVEKLETEQLACTSYNESLLGTVQLTDPFDPGSAKVTTEVYEARLNLTENGIMGTIRIPKIDVRLPIYHGVSSGVLEKGVGHLPNTSLPVGGSATHAVLSAHSGLPSATLFSNLTKLDVGDTFYLSVLGETLAYRIDQITVVKPSDTSALVIDREKDYVTLVTCTPYGVNSHRLLVRGERVPYVETDLTEPTLIYDYLLLILTLLVLVAVALTMIVLKRRQKKKKLLRIVSEEPKYPPEE